MRLICLSYLNFLEMKTHHINAVRDAGKNQHINYQFCLGVEITEMKIRISQTKQQDLEDQQQSLWKTAPATGGKQS